jgi:hypothetical protein
MKTPPPIKTNNPKIDYFVNLNDEQMGPYDFDKIKVLLEFKNINENTLIWKDGMVDWDKISNLDEFSGKNDQCFSNKKNEDQEDNRKKNIENSRIQNNEAQASVEATQNDFQNNEGIGTLNESSKKNYILIKTLNFLVSIMFLGACVTSIFDHRWDTYKSSNQFITESTAIFTFVFLIIFILIERNFSRQKMSSRISQFLLILNVIMVIMNLIMFLKSDIIDYRNLSLVWLLFGIIWLVFNFFQLLKLIKKYGLSK